ncbi:MAG: phosphohistidine phosphatase SixA [Planctomycetes bacterium]|nr:phosphohistidine phosphatase SixA [Planctomycetota bacterium]
MRVHFIRHAIAVPRGAPGVVDDASRELTREGIAKMRQQARGLAKLKIDLARIWTSPYARARQTADILADEFGITGSVRVLPALAPGGSFDAILEELAANASLNEAALVGHEPDLSTTIARLLTGMTRSILQLKKGGTACVRIDDFASPCRGDLCWLLTPRQLRSLG